MLFNLILAAIFFLPSSVEIADTPEKRAWGLMGRTSLAEGQGMLFLYPNPQHISVWMFNTYVDLSIAFIDEQGVVKEMHDLKAYPQMMDPKRQLRHPEDLAKYPSGDPILNFFHQKAVRSSGKVSYLLEMPSGWFRKNGIEIGDRLDDERLNLPQTGIEHSTQ